MRRRGPVHSVRTAQEGKLFPIIRSRSTVPITPNSACGAAWRLCHWLGHVSCKVDVSVHVRPHRSTETNMGHSDLLFSILTAVALGFVIVLLC
jgi:hypothetical protein